MIGSSLIIIVIVVSAYAALVHYMRDIIRQFFVTDETEKKKYKAVKLAQPPVRERPSQIEEESLW